MRFDIPRRGLGDRGSEVIGSEYNNVTEGMAVQGFRDIKAGSNEAYTAATGWDACTGLGSHDGAELVTPHIAE